MGVSPVPGVSLGSLWFFQIKSGLLVTSHVSLLRVLKYARGLNYGCRREEMQSAAVFSSFVPCFRLPLINVLPKLKFMFLLQWCISQCSHMFGCHILAHSSRLSENKFTNPTKYQLHFTYWIIRLHQFCQSPAHLTWPPSGTHSMPWHSTTPAVVICIILMQWYRAFCFSFHI